MVLPAPPLVTVSLQASLKRENELLMKCVVQAVPTPELLTAASSGPWELNRDVIPAGGEVSFLTGMAGAFERRGMYGDAADYFHLAVERAPEDAELVEQLERVTRKLEEE